MRRNLKGQFKESNDVSRSLSADRRTKAKTKVKAKAKAKVSKVSKKKAARKK